MQPQVAIKLLALMGALSSASPIAAPQAVTALISPSAAAPSGFSKNYSGTFGIFIQRLTASSSGATAIATQSPDGQPGPAPSSAYIASAISDGQPQAPTAPAAISQIGDGQIQGPTGTPTKTPTPKKTMPPITQIGDGQIQAPSGTPPPPPPPKTTQTPITQIGDGQIQAPTYKTVTIQSTHLTTTHITVASVSQISDHQPQAPTTASVITSVGTSVQTKVTTTQVVSARQAESTDVPASNMVGCKTNSTLEMTLKDGLLTDGKSRTGYIASNRQFQFDGPVQAGAIYTSGWSMGQNGSLALGGSTVFYQCLSGSFYNLYDQWIGGQCEPVTINALQLQDC